MLIILGNIDNHNIVILLLLLLFYLFYSHAGTQRNTHVDMTMILLKKLVYVFDP